MEKQNRSRKNGSTNWIATWIIIFFSFSHFFSAVKVNGETTMYSSGMDETTTYKDPLTSTYISITPLLSTVTTTLSQEITTAYLPSTTFFTEATTSSLPDCHQKPEFIKWGPDTDEKMSKGDDNFVSVCPSIDVPINAQNLGCFQLSTNGYITNGYILPFTPNLAHINADYITLMALWADIDTRFQGNIYYQIYDIYADTSVNKLQENLDEIKTLVNSFAQNTFTPVWALKVTWEDVAPFNTTNNEEELSFQFILATDGAVTYMAYIYCGMSWQTSRKAIMGYVYPTYSYFHRDSLTPEIFDLGSKGNMIDKTNGAFLFELSAQYKTNHAQRCLQWKNASSLPRQPDATWMIPCPCTLWMAELDARYTRGPHSCYYLTFYDYGYSKVCCYVNRSFWSALTRGNLQTNSAILSEADWLLNDYQPYTDCCVKSEYCSIYNTYRPVDFCSGYELPLLRWMFGDPHIQTLDGTDYTFNGLGEFGLLNIYNITDTNKVLMKIQCRTKEVGTKGSTATVFSAFVIQSSNVAIQMSARDNTNQMKIFSGDKELTNFYSDKNYVWNESPFFITTNKAENNSYIIRHESQTMIGISIKNGILQFTINLGYKTTEVKTNGLLGTYNNNNTDDLETPKGQVLPANLTEEEIYYKFGMLWKVNTSIFHYENSESQASYQYPQYIPSFVKINKTTNAYKEASKICTETDHNCIYDYLVTLNKDLAENTKQITKDIKINNLLSNLTSPNFDGTNSVTVNVNQKLVHVVNVNSTNAGLTLSVIQKESCNISISDKKVEISIELSKVSPVQAAFQVSDQYNMSTPLFNLTVMVCPLCDHGTCDKTSVNVTKSYQYTCKCNTGWRGELCNFDARCEPLTCQCTGPDNNYTCQCPAGYKFTEKCVDIDECTIKTDKCAQICLNTVGSYRCSCTAGYKLVNETECVNIDECKDLLNTCDQKCIDTNGSFTCDCFRGYKLNGTKCILETDLCTSTIDCSNASGCTLTAAGEQECFCKIGYKFNATSKKCEDVNECDTVTCNNGKCVNTVGSYACKCPTGTKLATDGRTCEGCAHNKWGENCANTCSGANCKTCNVKIGCECELGFKGVSCDDDIDECQNPSYCNTSISTCKNTIGSAICKCKIGFQLDQRGLCVDIDECTEKNDCSPNGACTNNFGSHTCVCNNGFKGDGITCTDIDECAKDNPCDQNCINQLGSFSCTCTGNAKLQDDRKTCKLDDGLSYQDRLYMIIFGSLGGAVVAGVLITLWCYCFGCCAWCACCRRRKRGHYLSTLNQDRLNVRDAFGSTTSSLRGRLVKNEPFAHNSMGASKYRRDWGDLSPYSDNNRQGMGADNQGWEDFGESSSSWGNINHFDNDGQFRIIRPKVNP